MYQYRKLTPEQKAELVKDGKIWIQHDGTEVGIATQLLERGVPKDDIVLAFHSPYMRQFTEFAAN